MSKIPTYTVTGFIDSGKTEFINKAIDKYEVNYGVIQFEQGDTQIIDKPNINVLKISFRNINQNLKYTSEKIFNFISDNSFDEIWIEVNGIMNFELLDKIFHNKFDKCNSISKLLDFKKTFNIATSSIVSILMGEQNTEIINQIKRSDSLVINENVKNNFNKIKYTLKNINNRLKIHNFNTEIDKTICSRSIPEFMKFLLTIVFISYSYYILKTVVPSTFFDINTVITSLFGIILQSFPFLLIGVILSSIIQIYVPSDFVDRHFPKDPLLGILFASLIGFVFPVCDCATIPVFRGLIKKGVPISASIAFMVATPVINPVVILSTYNAYNSNWKVVLLRCGLGFLCASIIGFIFHLLKLKDILKLDLPNISGCSTYTSPYDSKFTAFIKHIKGEFLNVAKFLIIGALISSSIQALLSNINFMKYSYGNILSIIIMMILAFMLSLCSSSDAVIARTLGTNMPFISGIAFLVYGPMIDLKNIILLSSSFKKSFIIKLTGIVTLVCFLVIIFIGVI